MVVLKYLIFNSFYFGQVYDGSDIPIFTVDSILGGCGGLERTDCSQFLYWEGVVVLEELLFHSFYIGKVWCP